ncbi:cupin domain-containing protein [Rhodanobacter denitrificans]|uniref:Cupin domain-containing protein n=1 Tax=Rhodanobacter denitrificans TaxID=666685 RepID=A0A368KGH1_9GAMM|nr:cupin domain-containing protein [Rhodanobacter denitrificans]RCS31010.1 cupin domain-containing protein [Rhodanobacter denitrificans]
MTGPVLNIDEVVVQTGALQGDTAARYDLRKGEIASRIGARKLGYRLTVVAPGKRACPFHSHHNEEEMFFILEGTGELRHGDARYPLRAGDVVACPPGGPETAHQIINTGTAELRYLAVSTMEPVEICEYPDSGKFGAFVDGEPRTFRHIGMPGDAHDYWEGE